MKFCVFCIATLAATIALAFSNDSSFSILGNSTAHERQTLGGLTSYDHSNGSTTYARQTLSGSTVYENSSGTWTHERQTLGGSTAYDHSDGTTTYTRQTLGGSTVYENSSGWSVTRQETYVNPQPVQRQGVVFGNDRLNTHGNATLGDGLYKPQTESAIIINHRRGSNANNPMGGGYSGDLFTPRGNFLK